MPYLIGLDIGTTSTIGILIDAVGGTLAIESRPVTLHAEHANWSEEDPAQWWANCGEICRALLARSGIAVGDIAGVGVTGMLPTVILLDDAARPGERIVARRWSRKWKDFAFTFEGQGSKGLLVGRKLAGIR